MVAGGKQCAPRSTITPSKTCSAIVYRRIKRRLGCSLKRPHHKGNVVPSRKQLHINYLELKVVFLALKEFQDICESNIVLITTDNTTVVAYINKEGGMKSGPLCALLWRILTWCTSKRVTLRARHPRSAERGSRQAIQTRPDNSNMWSLLPEDFQAICNRWHRPQIDLFATRFNIELAQFVSPVPDPLA